MKGKNGDIGAVVKDKRGDNSEKMGQEAKGRRDNWGGLANGANRRACKAAGGKNEN